MNKRDTAFVPAQIVDGAPPCAFFPLLDQFYHRCKHLTSPLITFSSVIVLLIMFLTVADVAGRFLLNMPVKGSMEILEILMILAMFPAFVWIEHQDSHLRVDLFTSYMTPGWRAVMDVFGKMTSVVFLAVLSWELWEQALTKYHHTENTLIWHLPIFPFFMVAALCLLLLALFSVLTLACSFKKALSHRKIFPTIVASALAAVLWILPFAMVGSRLGLSKNAFGAFAMLYLFILILSGLPIGISMVVAGLQGLILFMPKLTLAFGMAGGAPYHSVASLALSVVPMFILMGELALLGDVSTDLFRAASTCLGRLPGGLAIASVTGCAGFAAVCGDSMATAMTMASVGLPTMKEKKYNTAFGAASLGIGGTLGILIPPSMGFIMYAIVTEQSVGRLFMAGVVPGILLTAMISGTIILRVLINPTLAPLGQSTTMGEKLRSLTGILPMVVLFTIIMGGILSGLNTPTEGGAVGSFACLVYCLIRGKLTLSNLKIALKNTCILSAKIFLILIGVNIVGYLLACSRLPFALCELIVESGLTKYLVLALIIGLYTILGMLMNVIPMIMLVMPTLFPTVVALGFDPIWFGVITVLMMELGQITPPIGVLVFAMSSVLPEVPMMSIFRQVMPYFLVIFLCVLILIVFPGIALWLPNLLFN